MTVSRIGSIVDCENCDITIDIAGEFDYGLEIEGGSDNRFDLKVDIKKPFVRPAKIGRNERCFCGAGLKFKHCHGGVKMGTGINIKGGSNKFGTTLVVSEGDGIEVDGGNNSFEKTQVFITNKNASEIIAALKLPVNTPPELIMDAIKSASASGSVEQLEQGQLKQWLYKNGFNMAFWFQLTQEILKLSLGA